MVLAIGSPADPASWRDISERLAKADTGFAHQPMATKALSTLRSTKIQAIIVYRDPPDVTALGVCRILRQDTSVAHVPILVIGPPVAEPAVIELLEAGADDYLSNDITGQVVVARIKSILRRVAWTSTPEPASQMVEAGTLVVGPITMRPAQHTVKLGSTPLNLTASEFRLLSLLMSRPQHVFRRDQVFNALHSHDSEATQRSLDSHICTLRRKFASHGRMIETVRGVGFRINVLDQQSKPSAG